MQLDKTTGQKLCSRCKTAKSSESFAKSKKTKDGLFQWCKECCSAHFKAKRLEKFSQTEPEEIPLLRDFATILQAKMAEFHLTMSDIARHVGINQQYVRRWVRGTGVPYNKHLIKLCELLQIEVPLAVIRSKDGRLPVAIKDCVVCHKPFPAYRLTQETCSRYCGNKSMGKKQTGAGGNNWGGGRITIPSGYIKIRPPIDYPYKDKAGYVMEHRYVMSQVIGRPLEPHETVHHKDGDRKNNDPANLQLFTGAHGAGARLFDLYMVLFDSPEVQSLDDGTKEVILEACYRLTGQAAFEKSELPLY